MHMRQHLPHIERLWGELAGTFRWTLSVLGHALSPVWYLQRQRSPDDVCCVMGPSVRGVVNLNPGGISQSAGLSRVVVMML